MGYIHKIRKDKSIRSFVKLHELDLLINKYCWYSNELSYQQRLFFWRRYLNRYHLNSSSSRIVNRCIITGRAQWVLRRFRCSRMTFKLLANKGEIQGVRKASF